MMLERAVAVEEVVGMPLEASGALDQASLDRLHALSIASVEELIGVIAADPGPVSEFLGGVNLPLLQAQMVPKAAAGVLTELREFEGRRYATGARPARGVQVEARASLETFERHAGSQPDKFAVESGSGVRLGDCLGPVRAQGVRWTCVAHAVCAVMECLHFRKTAERIDLSEQFLYWNCKENDGLPQGGTYVDTAIRLAASDGTCLEETWPYNPTVIAGNEGQGPPPAPAQAEARTRRVDAAHVLGGQSAADIRKSLDDGRPVAFSVPRYNNWVGNPFVDATGRIPMPLPGSLFVDGHAMCAIGYRPDTTSAGGGYFIARNSWGAGWAPLNPHGPGHGHVPFAYVDVYGFEAATAS